jgi:hypothetical protein
VALNTEYPAETEAKQIIAALESLEVKLDKHAEAINALGANVQWIVDNVQGIFQMFSSPAFMQMIPQMMSGGMPDMEMHMPEMETPDGD